MNWNKIMLQKYPVKILIAFGEAIDGNVEIYKWLLNNGYPELAALTSAIHASRDALAWLLKNHPMLAILSNAMDREKYAINWLIKNNQDFLLKFAEACNNDQKARRWFAENNLEIFNLLAEKISEVLKQQKREHFDYHKFSFNQ